MGKNVIISVFDKTNLDLIAKFLIKKKYTIYSTGGTSRYLNKINIPHIEISKYTKQKEILDGRVKTLHPKIFGGILGTTIKSHQKEMKSEGIVSFDLLVINLYPFQETVNGTKDKSKIIEMIDIGGPSLLRAASKNYKYITPIIDHKDYPKLIKNLKKNSGVTDIVFRKRMALKIFKETSKYDKIISIEMIEAVGYEFIPLFFSKVSSLLKPDGLVALQGITYNDQQFDIFIFPHFECYSRREIS